jgi:hypothetical protein
METPIVKKEVFENFEKIPASALDNITSASIHEVTDEDIFKTADIADASTALPNDAPKEKGKTVNVNQQASTTPTKLGGLVGGELGTRLLDAAIPALIVTVIHYVGYKLDKQKLKFTQDDRKVIAPLMQDCLNAIEIDLNNPFYNLAFALSIVYAAKIVEEIPNMEKRGKTQPAKVIDIQDNRQQQHQRQQAQPMQDVEYDYSSVTQKPSVAKIAPEMEFKILFDELIESTRIATGRKSKRGAMSYLYQFERDKVKALLDRFGFDEPPNNNDYKWLKEKSKIDFAL